MTDYKMIVDKSTVPVGTGDTVEATVREALQARGVKVDFSVVSNPEFLKEGAAIEDFMKPDRVVIGTDDERATHLMRALYSPFLRNRDRLLVMDRRSAELTKYAANAMLATRISFMNELANLAERLGADIELVRQGIGSDPRIGTQFLYPGCGYGGSCFPKDVKALKHTGQSVGLDLRVLGAVEAVNDSQKHVLVDKIVAVSGPICRAAVRDLGTGVQAGHRRHARGAEPGDRRGAARPGRHGPRLRPGRDRRSATRTRETGGHRLCRQRRTQAPRAPTHWSSSPSGRSSAAPTFLPCAVT